MVAPLRSRGLMIADESVSATVRVRCPGAAHETGEACLICDEEDDGSILVVITEPEMAALTAAAEGRAFERALAPRLRLLGLLHDVAGYVVPTEEGFRLLGGFATRVN